MGTVIKKMFSTMHLLGMILSLIPADFGAEVVAVIVGKLKEMADHLLDIAEDYIAKTENTLDDKLQSAIDQVRIEFNIPDNDDVPEPGGSTTA